MIRLIQRVENNVLVKIEKFSPRFHGLAMRYRIYFKYIIAGGTAAFVDLSFLVFFKELFGFHYLLAAVFAFIIAFCVSFILQKFWTFSDGRMEGVHRQAAVYLMIALANLFMNTLLMYLFVDVVHVWYLFSQIMAAGLIALVSFFIYRRFVFKNTKVS